MIKFNDTACRFLKNKLILICVVVFTQCSLHAQSYDITTFGAKADGVTDNTAAIQKAIDECSKTGGKVIFPSGTYLSGTLILKSNTTLHLSAGATLLGSADLKAYPYLDAGIRFYGDQWARQSLIFCRDQENVSIEGLGTIDGQGAKFPVTTTKKPDRYKNRPYLLWFAGSRNITVRDVLLRNSAFWMQHYLGCEYVNIDGIKIWNHSNKNNDMLDIDGSKFVHISNVIGDSDDDGITIKSTSPIISEHITITNCIISSHCNALKFGTESTGGFRNVTVSNCVIKPSRQTTTIYGKPAGNGGLALEMVDGGIMENITIDNIVIEGPQVPIFVRLGNRARKFMDAAGAPPVGRMKNIRLSNITATGADTIGCSISGIETAQIEQISLSNISIETVGGGTAKGIDFKVEEKETEYPEGTMFGHLPAYGLFIRHAKEVTLSNIIIRSKDMDTRPGIVVNDVSQFSFSGLDIQSSGKTNSVIQVVKSRNGVIKNSLKHYPSKSFVQKDQLSVNILSD